MKAYKVFNKDMKCRSFQYETGKTYTYTEGEIGLCNTGFHACKRLIDCFNYYDFNPENKVCEVTLLGKKIHGDDKSVCSKIKIGKEISWNDVLLMVNAGSGNSGSGNSGDWNSGNGNSGDWNSGNGNSGDGNSGNGNSGNGNSGDGNSGDGNSGDRNSGYVNSGNRNSGNRNSGDRNSGDRNSGYVNSGNRNSGNRNSGDGNSGHFNTNEPDTIRVFNKECKKKDWDDCQKPDFIFDVMLNEWIWWDTMSDKEKESNKNAFVTDGYLKTFNYKDAWSNAFKKATPDDVELLKKLPNFNTKLFFEITGITII